MGYSCPVCSDPQADDIHLANHLAFTAIARGGDHETWLDENVPEWGQMDEERLATELVDFADQTEYPQVFEDTTTDHQHAGNAEKHVDSAPIRRDELPEGANQFTDTDLSEETDDILERARELTKQRHEDEEDAE